MGVDHASMRPRPEGRGEPARGRRPWPPLDHASMRPRPEGRGEPTGVATSHIMAIPLQCGHDPKAVENTRARRNRRARAPPRFNAATTRRPWRTAVLAAKAAEADALQCGHDPKAVENIRSEDQDRRMDRFNAATTRRPWRTAFAYLDAIAADDASMRPRPEGRGEPCSPATRPAASRRLQCGHDPKAVENSAARGGRSLRPTRFNAATTRRPWRTPSPLT